MEGNRGSEPGLCRRVGTEWRLCRKEPAYLPKSIDRAPLSRRKSWGETLRISIKAIAPSTVVITAPDVPA